MGATTATRRPAGAVLDGRYELVSLLGRGGMADVYEATDRRLGRRVAVKMLREDLTGDPRLLARFRREARAAAALSHPHIAAVHDTGTHDGAPYIVMERVEGRTLAEVLAEEGPLPFARVAELGAAIAGALACAHASGIVHRDLKPGNVMLTGGGEVKVVDFGIAWAARWTPLDDGTRPQGTAEYVSPEQARGEELDGRSDVYSLGVVLYELLTGSPPFLGESALAVAYRHLEEVAPRPESRRAGIPSGLSDIVMWCLAKSPADRPRRAEEVRGHLMRLLAAGPTATAPLPRIRTTRPLPVPWRGDDAPSPSRRSPRWIVPVLVAVALTAAGMGVLWAQAADAPPPRPPALRPPDAVVAEGACDGFLRASVTVRWTAPRAGSVDGYEVFRSTATGGPYERTGAVVDGSASSFVDRELEPATTYFYVIRATRGVRTSPLSGQAQVATPFACLW